jgi:oxepin-CoA hydrolase/3-oxo-5,6-dehydrosuberyl-CoA semialdehyde dehydrogenase
VLSLPFDVNDAAVRERFLRDDFLPALAPLRPDTAARWGGMSAQQMVEHLAWTFRISTGRTVVDCPVPETERQRMKPFLYRNMPTPPGFMNPLLVEGLPELVHPGLGEAVAALGDEVRHYLALANREPDAVHTHPLFGPLGMEEWSRTHYKHCHHHLLQFGLLAAPERAPRS